MRVLGVDGGQSGIRLAHSEHAHIVEVAGVSRLEGDVVVGVADAVIEGWRRAGFAPVERVVLGLTTAPFDRAEADRLSALVAEATGATDVWLADDTVTSHAGALSGGHGVSLIAGTGVACLAVPEIGRPRVIDGHGFLLGDAGGAFWVGSRGLRAALKATDGRASATRLTTLATEQFGDLATLPIRLHSAARPVNMIAHFARAVQAAADAGDAAAGVILDAAAEELFGTIRAGVLWANGSPTPVALGGGLLVGHGPLRQRLDLLLATEDVRSHTVEASALDGALRIGVTGVTDRYLDLIHVWKVGTST
ncbi:BadF/BadG/BcrA/BcrD ATPase family protein [Glaciibacter psychrotolerans]|uniref:N-acetylglucosamine kinase-like BadF-type ATPase n=1 Tax=Glaciibacter psychrotolerans TaxID=670054 RepID=A0A7Z0EB28_9MICO|nr:BadF/BadG/BcrA/BcrD ATPase family protein [Leifsonia psychrotolerans]NYJ18378.1 N-acetylglucosamine kinase-like BadF-type ATPase [Leifsonia psychrotolerans]